MFKIIVTIILVSAFFILFFNPTFELQNKTDSNDTASTTAGFIEDTDDGFIIPSYPSPLIKRDSTGKIKPIGLRWRHWRLHRIVHVIGLFLLYRLFILFRFHRWIVFDGVTDIRFHFLIISVFFLSIF